MADNNGTVVFTPSEEEQAQALWSKCYTFLTTLLSEQDLERWIKPIVARGYKNNQLTLRVPSEAFCNMLESRFTEQFQMMERLYLKEPNSVLMIEYNVMPEPALLNPSTHEGTTRERKAEDYITALREDHSFDTFIESDCNRLARTVAETVAMYPGQDPTNVLFIHGPSGVGKTHLSQAIGQRVRLLHPDKRVCYVSCTKFETQYAKDANFHQKMDFLEFYQQMDVLIIDDIQGLIGKVKTQQAFFEIFNHLYLLNKQIVLTCDVAPADFHGIEERILTRLQASMKLALARPDIELRRKILRSRLATAGITLGDEVVEYLAEHHKNNVRELEGTMRTLIPYCRAQIGPIDIHLASSIMGQTISMTKPDLSLEQISKFVAEEFGIEVEDLRSSSRAKKFAQPRQVVMYLCNKHTSQTLMTIAQKLKRKNHTTVMHGIQSITNLMEQDHEFKANLENLEQRLLARG